MMLTYSFGKHTVPTGGSLNAGGTNMTMSQWIADALKKTVEPTIKRYPNAGLSASCSNSGASLEVGSYITSVSYTGSLSEDGDYETNGKETASGIVAGDLSWEVTLGDDAETKKTTSTGSYTTNIQINSTTANTVYATVKAKATLSLGNVVTPVNNLGEANSDVKITGFDANGTTVKSLSADVKASGYRNTWYYVGTDNTFELNSANIRTKCTAKNSNTRTFGTLKIDNGTKRVILAVLGNYDITKVIDEMGMGLSVHGDFTKYTVAIEGANGFEAANYSVFVYENANGTNYPEGYTNFKDITFAAGN